MNMRLSLALRNIFRHRGRTAVSLLMVAGAVAGLAVFTGFADYILSNMQRIVIDNEVGHIQVAKRSFWDLEPGNRKGQLIQGADALYEKINSDPAVKSASGRISFFGLISSGEITISAKGMGFNPAKEVEYSKNLPMSSGEGLNIDSKFELILGVGLQKKINVPVGGNVTVLGYTLDGVVNAIDMKVKGIFHTSNAEIDNNVFIMPLATAQTLLDTDLVESISIRLKETGETNAARARLQAALLPVDAGFQAKTWNELSTFYRQTDSFFKVQNRVIRIILLSLVFLGILNTVGMAVYERTGEIGTVRALGENTLSVIWQFTLEGILIGIMGAVLGAILGCSVGAAISNMKLMLELPGTSTPVPILINFVPLAYVQSMGIAILAATAATWIPSVRATKMSIVEALKKNI